MGLVGVLTKEDTLSWHMHFVLLVWYADMIPREAA